ncbi:hypothetical protein BUALT_Bualt01G0227100 [Buddleja alternifolia]|uniref:Uncharacterized protein n=1 Tax=Buddleja alternifolia TaxID=168488 RepID=A0AAV6YJS6_9LAMI|nr:hypothetical protein BUALT_Bualt01G0227100 [Buddleja alternifolia]
MSSQSQNDDAWDLQEAEAEEEVQKLEEEVQLMADKILEYRTSFPGQLSSTILSTRLIDEGSDPEALPRPDSEAAVSQDLMRTVEPESTTLLDIEAEMIQVLKHKISSNASTLPIILKRMKEYIARIDKLAPTNGIIHPAFKMKQISRPSSSYSIF